MPVKISNVEKRQCFDVGELSSCLRFIAGYAEGDEFGISKTHVEMGSSGGSRGGGVLATSVGVVAESVGTRSWGVV